MNKYNLTILIGGGFTLSRTVFATKFNTVTNSSNSQGYYSFYDDNDLVVCYPLNRTIIDSIELID